MKKEESGAYYKALGAHMCWLRKEKGMTQNELARKLGVSQQAVFAYEVGERRVSVLMLKKVAALFGVSVNKLASLGQERGQRRSVKHRRVSPRALQHARRLQTLRKTQQRFVIRIIDALEMSNTETPTSENVR